MSSDTFPQDSTTLPESSGAIARALFRLITSYPQGDYILIFDPRGAIVWSNDAEQVGMEFSSRPRSAESFYTTIHPSDRDRVRMALQGIDNLTARQSILFRMQNSDGHWCMWEGQVIPVSDRSCPECQTLFRIRDVSDMIAMQEDIIQAERAALLGSLIPALAHDINNPLEGMKNCLYLLKYAQTEEDRLHYIEMIGSEVVRIASNIKQLLKLHSTASIRKELIDVGEVLNACLKLLEYRMHFLGLRIELDHSQGPFNIFGYRGQIKQVLLFLLDSTIKSFKPKNMPDDDQTGEQSPRLIHLSYRLEPSNHCVEVTIRHRGPNILHKMAYQTELNESLVTTSSSKDSQEEFLIIKMIITDHAGTLSITSNEDGSSEIGVTFPQSPDKNCYLVEQNPAIE